jgi:hypothetical protein
LRLMCDQVDGSRSAFHRSRTAVVRWSGARPLPGLVSAGCGRASTVLIRSLVVEAS